MITRAVGRSQYGLPLVPWPPFGAVAGPLSLRRSMSWKLNCRSFERRGIQSRELSKADLYWILTIICYRICYRIIWAVSMVLWCSMNILKTPMRSWCFWDDPTSGGRYGRPWWRAEKAPVKKNRTKRGWQWQKQDRLSNYKRLSSSFCSLSSKLWGFFDLQLKCVYLYMHAYIFHDIFC